MQRQQGRVKWFNAKGGYGFVTLLETKPEGVGADGQVQQSGPPREVFVHHSGLKVGSEQFRYLVEGEYVELEVLESGVDGGVPRGGVPRYQGVEVRGIGGGPLMCETRSESSVNNRQTRVEGQTQQLGTSQRGRGGRGRGVQRHRPSAELA
jgi:cold shock CspA family protein